MRMMQDAGPIVLITRPETAAARFLDGLRAGTDAAFEAIVAPLMRIVALPVAVRTAGLAGIVLTSENGAAVAAGLGLAPGLPAFCVGARTAEVARHAGFDALVAAGNADALVAMILSRGASGRLLHLRGAHVRGDVAARLRQGGVSCDEAIVYEQVEQPLSVRAQRVLSDRRAVIAPLFSPRTVSILAQHGPFSAPLNLVAISEAVEREAAVLRPARLVCARTSDSAAMCAATIDMIAKVAEGSAHA